MTEPQYDVLVNYDFISLALVQKDTHAFNQLILKVPSGTHKIAFENGVTSVNKLQPKLLANDRMAARIEHLQEELQELTDAYAQGNGPEVVDGLIDTIYIALGTLSEMHVDASRAFKAVHEANMLKVNGKVAKRPNAGEHDAVKPEGWTPPDVAGAIGWVYEKSATEEAEKED